jgi:hypothetical protein
MKQHNEKLNDLHSSPYIFGDQIEIKEMDETCRVYEREGR